MLTAPKLPGKTVQELCRLARDIPRCPGAPARQQALIAEFNALAGLALAPWQFDGAVYWPGELRSFVECALSHTCSPDAPSDEQAAAWIVELRARAASAADVHHTLRSLERRARRPHEVARLVFHTHASAAELLAAIEHDEDGPARRLLARTEEQGVELGDVAPDELAAIVALADEGVDCGDRGDRAGLAAAARSLSRRLGQRVTEQELRALPGAIDTESWARGVLLARDLLRHTALTWAGFVRAVSSYFAAIDAAREPAYDAFAALLDAATPYPHLRVHPEMRADGAEQIESIALEISRHVEPWGDPPPAPTVDDAWDLARAWTCASEVKDHHRAAELRKALQSLLDRVDVPALRELLPLPGAQRRARSRVLGLLPPEGS